MRALFLCILSAFSVLCFSEQRTEITTPPFKPIPEWFGKAVIYQIYPASFQDSDGDGIGDIPGITRHLDYVKSIGCNTIWLNPCFKSRFRDGGYDVVDYYQVASRYGANKDLRELFDAAHARGMHVILDLVAGHTSNENPWFIQSQKAEANAYSKRYIWTGDSTVCPTKFIKGKFERNGCYLKNYFDFQPALNYGYGEPDPSHPWEEPVDAEAPTNTRKELMRIMDYWMEMGCDGFRIDMAGSLVKNDPQFTGTKYLWNEIRRHFQDKWPEGVMLAEWGHPEKAKAIGFMADFIFQFGKEGYRDLFFNETGVYRRDTCYFDRRGQGNASRFINTLNECLKATGDDAYICIPTGNHDIQRLNCGNRKSKEELEVAMTFLLTQPAIPCIYYGDEIGIRYKDGLPDVEGSCVKSGNRAGARTPMLWDTSRNAGFSTAPDSCLYLPLSSNDGKTNVAAESADKTSLLNYIKTLLNIRNNYYALDIKSGVDYMVKDSAAYPLCYIRTSFKKERLLIIVNPSGEKRTVSYDVPDVSSCKLIIGCGSKIKVGIKQSTVSFTVPPVSAAIYEI